VGEMEKKILPSTLEIAEHPRTFLKKGIQDKFKKYLSYIVTLVTI
jgi:hypothetical protein